MTPSTVRGDYLARHGAALIDNGFSIVPIPPGTKGPRQKGWESIESTHAQLETWLAGPQKKYGVGILTKKTPAVDIDLLDANLSAYMVEWVQYHIGSGLVRIGLAPKTLLLFRTDEPFFKVTSASFVDPKNPTKASGKPLRQRIEILGEGQQFVAYHIHPDTQKPYVWPTPLENPLDTGASALPKITEEQAHDICNEFERLATKNGWQRVGSETESLARNTLDQPYDPLAEVPPPPETPTEVARVKSAIAKLIEVNNLTGKNYISEASYEQWFSFIAALKWTQWDSSYDLAKELSEASIVHTDEHFERTWRGAQKVKRAREFTLGTVFHHAKEHGWEAPEKETTIREELDALAALMEEIDFFTPSYPANAPFFKKVVNANLSLTNTEAVLLAIKRKTDVTMPILRKELAAARKADLGGELPTHAGYAASYLKIVKAAAGVEPVGVAGKVYTFSQAKGIWIGKMTAEFAVEIADEFDGQEKCERRSDYTAIASHLYDLCAKGNEQFFEEAPVGLACEGRFYKVTEEGTIEKEELTSRHRQRMLSPVRPVVGAMPMFTKLLNDTFDGDVDGEQINLLQEVLGATVLGFMFKFEKAVLMKGVGRSGKGTLLKIAQACVPPDQRTAVGPDRWEGEYYLSNIANKRLNVVGELSDERPIPAAAFKTVIGRDLLIGRDPGHKPFSFRNEAAHIFNTNPFIYTKDHSEAFYSRWILIHFRNSRIGIEGGIDVDLADHIIEHEMSAVLAWMLQGAKRLLARGHFVETKAHKLLMAQWRHRTSTLMEFLLDEDECKLQAKGHTRRKAFYEAYAQWCKDSNRRPIGKIKLYDDIATDQIAALAVSLRKDNDGNDIVKGVVLKAQHLIWQDESDTEDDPDFPSTPKEEKL